MASEYLKWKYKDVPQDKPLELTKQQKRKNWWHYHKWHVIIGAILLVTAGSILAHALGLGQTKPDYQIAYVGAAPLPEDTVKAIEAQLVPYGEDVNNDGKVVFKINQYPTDSNEEGADAAVYASGSSIRLMGDLESKQSCLFILENYEDFQKKYDVLADGSGSIAKSADTVEHIRWGEGSVLKTLELGSYTDTVLGKTISGDSNELMKEMYLTPRGYLPDDNEKEQQACRNVWARLKGE